MRKTATAQLDKLVKEVGLPDVLQALATVCYNTAGALGQCGRPEATDWIALSREIEALSVKANWDLIVSRG